MTGWRVYPGGSVATATHGLDPADGIYATREEALAAALADCAKEHTELRRRRVALNKRQDKLRKQLGLAP